MTEPKMVNRVQIGDDIFYVDDRKARDLQRLLDAVIYSSKQNYWMRKVPVTRQYIWIITFAFWATVLTGALRGIH